MSSSKLSQTPIRLRKSESSLPSASPQSKHITRNTSPPLKNISLNKFLYILSGLAFLIAFYYCWRIVQLERAIGGWWNPSSKVLPGTRSGRWSRIDTDGVVVERKIRELAESFGVPAKVLASAISRVVKEYYAGETGTVTGG